MITEADDRQDAAAAFPDLEFEPDLSHDVEDVTDRLADRLGDTNPRDALRSRVRHNFSAFRDVAVRQFVPVFVERRVRAELGH